MNFLTKRDWQEEALDDVQRQLARLNRELQSLRHGGQRSLQHGAHDLGDMLTDEASDVARQIGRGARKVAKTAQQAGTAFARDPVPGIVAAIGIACLISMMMSRRS